MEEMYVYKNQKKLRWGYTTGTCGTAASMAAALMLLGQKRVGQVKVSTPKGLDLDLEIEEIRFTKEQAVCAVRKDSGDDPDVTNGIAIYSTWVKIISLGTGLIAGFPTSQASPGFVTIPTPSPAVR